MPAAWKDRRVSIVFEGVMTDAEVRINGQPAGPVHQGGFYRFHYDITHLLRFGGTNQLEVTVSKESADSSVNRAERQGDFWALSGIYRPVYLQVTPSTFIEHVAADARADGTLSLRVLAGNTRAAQRIEVQLQDLNGKAAGPPFSVPAADSTVLSRRYSGIRTWNPEDPHLYEAVIRLKEGSRTVHMMRQRIGFRTMELRRRDGIYVNGVKVIFRGVNRHSAWPESGRTLSRDIHLMDIRLMKEMNMNAVRMSHYPPDAEFLDLCDSLGLFVLDELTGWQKAYDEEPGRRLVKELVRRDLNHPSVVLWANGNEGGWNRALDDDFHFYDPQKRPVYHPWEKFNGTDTRHYPDFAFVADAALNGDAMFFPTEFMHGLYDGGHGAGLEDFWAMMRRHPYFAGGFLWALHDEGIVRTDRGGQMDTHGNHAPDGILGPHREKEGSNYTIRELWSPVQLSLGREGDQIFLEVENQYLYSDLNSGRYAWKLVRFSGPQDTGTAAISLRSGSAPFPSIRPGEKRRIPLSCLRLMPMPSAWPPMTVTAKRSAAGASPCADRKK